MTLGRRTLQDCTRIHDRRHDTFESTKLVGLVPVDGCAEALPKHRWTATLQRWGCDTRWDIELDFVVLVISATGSLREVTLKSHELRAQSRLHARELLLVEQPAALTQARIWPRRHCILMTVGYARALIWPDRVYLFSGHLPQVREYAAALRAQAVAARPADLAGCSWD